MKQTVTTKTDNKIESLIDKFFKKQNSNNSSVRADIARDNARYEKRQREAKERETGEQVFGQNVDVEIPLNQNSAPISEIREDYIWQIVAFIVVVFLVGIYFVSP